MADENETFTVYPAAGWHLSRARTSGDLILEIQYYDAKEPPRSQADIDRATRSLRVIMSETKAGELGALLTSLASTEKPGGPTH